MTQISTVINSNDKNLNATAGLDYDARESVVDALVEQGLPGAFNPNNFIEKIAEEYGISIQDAKSCLKEAIAILETKTKAEAKEKETRREEEQLYAQSGYFYPSNETQQTETKDGMDGLVAFGTFQKLKFGL